MFKDFAEVAAILRTDLHPFNSDMNRVLSIITHPDFDINAIIDPETGRTVLHSATRCYLEPSWSRLPVIEACIARGAEVDKQDNKGLSALHSAVNRNYKWKFVQLLLKAGANGFLESAKGATPFDVAFHNNASIPTEAILEFEKAKKAALADTPKIEIVACPVDDILESVGSMLSMNAAIETVKTPKIPYFNRHKRSSTVSGMDALALPSADSHASSSTTTFYGVGMTPLSITSSPTSP
ncbi:MAG: ankyrin repeat domain-containing protein [Gammaproteobacteria bacterium]|nr:ankyrin repeat domain-containing protein [Gammaproteobacteria bacterium]